MAAAAASNGSSPPPMHGASLATSRALRMGRSTRGEVTARMIVDEDDPVRPLPNDGPERVARVHRTLREAPARDEPSPQQPAANVEQHDVELLFLLVREVAHQFVHGSRIEAAVAALRLVPGATAAELEHGREASGFRAGYPEQLRDLVCGCPS